MDNYKTIKYILLIILILLIIIFFKKINNTITNKINIIGSGETLKIMSYNIFNNQLNTINKIRKKIIEESPDILCTQEDSNKLLLLNSSEFSNIYNAYSCGGNSCETVSIYYKKELKDKIKNITCLDIDGEKTTNLDCYTSKRNCIIIEINDIKIANLHLEGGRYSDKCIQYKDGINTVINHKHNFIKKIINEKPDIICGDFNSIYASNKQLYDKFMDGQYTYFNNIVNNNNSKIKKSCINELNNIVYIELKKNSYEYSIPINEEKRITNIRGKSIIDTVWYKSNKINKITTEILDYGGGYSFDENDIKSLSDHNPLLINITTK